MPMSQSPTLTLIAALMMLCSIVGTGSADEGERLHDLFDAEWEWTLRESPTLASHLGDLRYNTQWSDISLEAIDRRHQHRLDVLGQLDGFDVEQLSETDRLNLTLFRKQYQTEVDGYAYRWHFVPMTHRDGIQEANSLADSLRFEKVKDYEDWIARLQAFGTYMDQTIALMQAGVEAGLVQPKVVMQRVPGQIARQIVDDPQQSLFYKPFRQYSDDISEADRKRLTEQAEQAIADVIVPSYRKLQTIFESEYLPACFDKVGVWQTPDGKDFYAFRARRYTTTDMTPKQIHEIGQREVKRIRAEMEKIVEQVGFEGTFDEFLEHLRHDPKFYYDNPNDLLQAYQEIGKRVDPELPRLFGKLPKIPYDVQAIPMHIAPDTTTAYYRRPSADGRRPGTYFVNLFRPEVRPKYEIEALSLHESVPGHHLQIALAMELENLPEFRRYTGYTAFVEGWGLYAESLGEEIGLYQDPYSKFGQLTYEMWRAVRLVVDTGMHAFGWSRQEAIDFFAANAAKTLHDIENEIDRYIAWPGQALAYKIGELKLKELRSRAEQELGDEFNIRKFHDVVLSNGAVPLDVLEQIVDEWIVRQKA